MLEDRRRLVVIRDLTEICVWIGEGRRRGEAWGGLFGLKESRLTELVLSFAASL
jgi:hypothetical protein